MKLSEIGEVGDFVSKHLDPDASTIWGARVDENMHGKLRVITIITGVQSEYILGPKNLRQEPSTQPVRQMQHELGIKCVY